MTDTKRPEALIEAICKCSNPCGLTIGPSGLRELSAYIESLEQERDTLKARCEELERKESSVKILPAIEAPPPLPFDEEPYEPDAKDAEITTLKARCEELEEELQNETPILKQREYWKSRAEKAEAMIERAFEAARLLLGGTMAWIDNAAYKTFADWQQSLHGSDPIEITKPTTRRGDTK